ncbi:unnamed protein product [Lactuca virosa]|uniref:S-protein homolog n=1 Tax=Lactuca virosa TaxID=75947 RepID=A0AAU9LKJ5_9ASTR|nr:unnamed protein product [Lactuca virosa]
MSMSRKSHPFIYAMLHLSFFIHVSYSVLKAIDLAASKPFEPYRIFITNRDVETMIVQCPPEGDERGLDVMKPGNTITWRFRRDIFDSTRYDCNFYSLKEDNQVMKSITLAVFNNRIAGRCGHNLFSMNRCYWIVTKYGFYLSKHNQTFPNLYDWQVMYVWDTI